MIALVILALLGVFLMMSGVLGIGRKSAGVVATLGIGAALLANTLMWDKDVTALNEMFNKMMIVDNYGLAMVGVILASAFGLFLLSDKYFSEITNYFTEHYALYIFALVGMICMVMYNNLSMLFIGIEIMSVSLYILAGSNKTNLASNEASLKYFLMGSFATGILLMGIALIYGATGSFYLSGIESHFVDNPDSNNIIALVGMFLLLIGMAFKVSVAPFHFWAPDVYEGSPTFVTAFMSTAVKVAGFASFYKLMYICFTPNILYWESVVWVMIVLTISVGSITALIQTGVKRLLAYSSVSHAGYMLITILTANEDSDLLFYTAAYVIASLLAFGVLFLVIDAKGDDKVESFNGLSKSNPFLAFSLTVAMASMAGLPLTAGFFAKFYVLTAAVKDGYIYLVLIAIVNAMVGIYYYFKVVIAMFFKEESSETISISVSPFYKLVLTSGILATIVLGVYPDLVYNLI
ncbi:MAG: hypothetical protein RLZZ175_937 [Bacteroidota bacterium]|jgi:NADH-quinone oxidoreductase subunit N